MCEDVSIHAGESRIIELELLFPTNSGIRELSLILGRKDFCEISYVPSSLGLVPNGGCDRSLWIQIVRLHIVAPLSGCVTLDKSPDLSVSQLLHRSLVRNSPHLRRLLREVTRSFLYQA